jgi:hypothetical protein
MGIKPRFTKQQIKAELLRQAKIIEEDLIKIMIHVGEQFVTEAQEGLNIDPSAFPKGDYKDQTANLRNSIGVFVLKNGNIIYSKMEGTGNPAAAAKDAMQKVRKISGIQLIGVAGMNYASHVESKGYNVITSQGEVAAVNLDRLWKDYVYRRNLQSKFNI